MVVVHFGNQDGEFICRAVRDLCLTEFPGSNSARAGLAAKVFSRLTEKE